MHQWPPHWNSSLFDVLFDEYCVLGKKKFHPFVNECLRCKYFFIVQILFLKLGPDLCRLQGVGEVEKKSERIPFEINLPHARLQLICPSRWRSIDRRSTLVAWHAVRPASSDVFIKNSLQEEFHCETLRVMSETLRTETSVMVQSVSSTFRCHSLSERGREEIVLLYGIIKSDISYLASGGGGRGNLL